MNLQNFFENFSESGFSLPQIKTPKYSSSENIEEHLKGYSLIYLMFNDKDIEEIKSKIDDLVHIKDIYKLNLGNRINKEIKNTRINVDMIVTDFNPQNPENIKFRLFIENPKQISIINKSKSFLK